MFMCWVALQLWWRCNYSEYGTHMMAVTFKILEQAKGTKIQLSLHSDYMEKSYIACCQATDG